MNNTSQVSNVKYNKFQKNTDADLSSFVFGKTPPQAAHLEEAILGAMIIDKEAVWIIGSLLTEDTFYSDVNKAVFKAIIRLQRSNKPIDLLTTVEELKKMGLLELVGGAYYLVELTNKVASSANIEYHARLLAQKHLQREMINVSTKIIRDSYEDTTDVFDLIAESEKAITDVNNLYNTAKTEDLKDLAIKAIKQYDKAVNGQAVGVPSGFDEVDDITNGWQNGDLIVVAARPSMGKSVTAIQLALNAASAQIPTLFFTLEMSKEKIFQRALASYADLEAKKIVKGTLDELEHEKLIKYADKLSLIPLHISDISGMSINDLALQAKKMKVHNNIGLIVVDYLQLLKGEKNTTNREQEISSISRNLKVLAKQLDLPIIALSQLSRAVESRGGSKKPMLSDLRESGAIEQDADIVSFLYRPEYYAINEYEDGSSTLGTMEFIIQKHRDGELGTVRLKTEFKKQQVKNLRDSSKEFKEYVNNTITIHRDKRSNDDIPF